MSVNNCWRDAKRQVDGLLRQGTIGNPDAGDFTRQGVLLGGSCWLGHGFLLEVVKTTSGCKSGGVRGSVLGLQLFGKAVEMKCDLLGRFQRRQMPDVREHLKNGARDSRQQFAFEALDGVDLVLIA